MTLTLGNERGHTGVRQLYSVINETGTMSNTHLHQDADTDWHDDFMHISPLALDQSALRNIFTAFVTIE